MRFSRIGGLSLVLALTACTTEATALPAIPKPPSMGRYGATGERTKTQSGNTIKEPLAFNFTLARDNQNNIDTHVNELLGQSLDNTFTYTKTGVGFLEQDSQTQTWPFTDPVMLVTFPVHVGTDIPINANSQRMTTDGHQYKLVLKGDTKVDRISEQSVHGQPVRVYVLHNTMTVTFYDVNYAVSDEDGGNTVQTTQTLRDIDQDIWFAPSYGLFVGGNITQKFYGSNPNGSDDNTEIIHWNLTTLDPK